VTFKVAVIFLFVYFVRPQDWVPGLSGFNIVRPIMALGLISLFIREPKITRKEFFSTPIDYLLVVFLLYIAFTAEDFVETVKELFPYFAFYFVTKLALTDSTKLARYLGYWLCCLILIAIAGLLTKAGIDFTHASDRIAKFNNRLVVNTWLLNNPNSLGHAVVLALPLSYLLLWWKRHPAAKLLAIGCAAIAFQCAYYTESKGAFLVGAATIVAAFTFGRPIFFQIIIFVMAGTIGVGGLMFLPRMTEMNNLRADEGVLGRLMAWEAAKTAYENNPTGVGWKQFIAVLKWEGETLTKATHSSFVKVGADLGRPGLFLYLCMLCCGLRALFQYKGLDENAERCRRSIFLLVASIFASGWLIDHPYHTEYFLILAAASAYMHLSLRLREPETATELAEISPPPLQAQPVLQLSANLATPHPAEGGALPFERKERFVPGLQPPKKEETSNRKPFWRRYSLIIDLILGYLALRAVLWFWSYILETL